MSDRLKSDLSACVEMLRKLEWNIAIDGEDGCPSCYQYKRVGHRKSCKLAKLLAIK